ncbi:DUF1823 family protein [Synechococcus sp. PCC 6312]|uniref:DUF1823 family protein n=1 Tax=Synechococcus sp. (strain ATCC 27167 / PCC 6312) TaxID=195253 RepID=UPI00029F3768|nr:DUF1823 family protein [Synechococcus sp. PCC 6312]AFY61640.1 protein of unknown function (DUF1823) [Synechococcus sp. PCC 6312]
MIQLQPITLEIIWGILRDEVTDEQVNHLVWQTLGYAWDETTQAWDLSQVSPEWQVSYPEPPDFIASRPATVKLTRSIPPENKQLLKEQLGFAGYSVSELKPRLTRRATAANWLLSYLQQQS